MKKPGKPTSKRTPVRLRHKIEKASAAKQRKQKKAAKSNPEWRSRLKKDPGIPNLFPYKERILQEIEEKKRLKEEDLQRKKEEAKSSRASSSIQHNDSQTNTMDENDDALSDLIDTEAPDEDAPNESSNPMSALLASARARAAEFDDASDEEDDRMEEDDASQNGGVDVDTVIPSSFNPTIDSSRRSFDKVFKQVLSSSDILLYVLDARDPNGTRSREIEREITAADAGSKRLILILNKIDLVPPPVLKAWLTYLRRYFPTLPLRANSPAPNARTFDHKALTVRGTSETLLRALKSYASSKQLKRSTTVGIVGYPNVGKSSVINALTSRLGSSRNATVAAPFGAEAGVTTALREVKLDNKLKLLDSPGIVFPSSTLAGDESIPIFTPKQLTQANLTLLSALPPSAISDPVPAITLLLHRLSRSEATLAPLLDQYNLPPSTLVPTGTNGDVTTDFLIQVARKRGRLGKGGVPNLQSAAMGVLMDWRDGRIRGWVEAPKGEEKAESKDQKEIVKGWAEEFKLEGLWGDDGAAATTEADDDVMKE